jgi:hypothetical protein
VRTWRRSTDPDFVAKRDRIVELYEMAEAGEAIVICLDEFGPLNLQSQPGGKGWAPRAKPKRIRATYKRPHGVRHLISAYDIGRDRLYGHIKKRKDRPKRGCISSWRISVPTTARRCASGPHRTTSS